jgi:hypothetical protein
MSPPCCKKTYQTVSLGNCQFAAGGNRFTGGAGPLSLKLRERADSLSRAAIQVEQGLPAGEHEGQGFENNAVGIDVGMVRPFHGLFKNA